MSDVSLSVIVPVFNVERYIDKCAESLFQSFLPEVEYIFVDDCTPDQSIEHVRAKAKEFQIPGSRIRFLKNYKNEGLSVTRNHGAEVASGRYIWFVDSDDWIADGILPKLVTFLKQNQPEILALNAIQTDSKDYSIDYTPYLKNYSGVFEGKKILSNTSPCAPFYIFDNQFWKNNHFSFYPGIYHEDMELIPKVVYLSNHIMVFSETVYYYRIVEGSIVMVPKLKRSMDLLFVAKRLMDFMKESVKPQEQIFFADLIAIVLTSSFNNTERLKKEEQRLFWDALARNRHIFSVNKKCSHIKHRLLYLFQLIPLFFLRSFCFVFYKTKK